MALSSLKSVKKLAAAEFEADLTPFGEGEEIKLMFRRPSTPDYFPPADLRKKLLISFPELAGADPFIVNGILLMGACYQPDKGEVGEPWRAVAQLSRDSSMAFLSLLTQFNEAFPDMSEAKAEAKND